MTSKISLISRPIPVPRFHGTLSHTHAHSQTHTHTSTRKKSCTHTLAQECTYLHVGRLLLHKWLPLHYMQALVCSNIYLHLSVPRSSAVLVQVHGWKQWLGKQALRLKECPWCWNTGHSSAIQFKTLPPATCVATGIHLYNHIPIHSSARCMAIT